MYAEFDVLLQVLLYPPKTSISKGKYFEKKGRQNSLLNTTIIQHSYPVPVYLNTHFLPPQGQQAHRTKACRHLRMCFLFLQKYPKQDLSWEKYPDDMHKFHKLQNDLTGLSGH